MIGLLTLLYNTCRSLFDHILNTSTRAKHSQSMRASTATSARASRGSPSAESYEGGRFTRTRAAGSRRGLGG